MILEKSPDSRSLMNLGMRATSWLMSSMQVAMSFLLNSGKEAAVQSAAIFWNCETSCITSEMMAWKSPAEISLMVFWMIGRAAVMS